MYDQAIGRISRQRPRSEGKVANRQLHVFQHPEIAREVSHSVTPICTNYVVRFTLTFCQKSFGRTLCMIKPSIESHVNVLGVKGRLQTDNFVSFIVLEVHKKVVTLIGRPRKQDPGTNRGNTGKPFRIANILQRYIFCGTMCGGSRFSPKALTCKPWAENKCSMSLTRLRAFWIGREPWYKNVEIPRRRMS